MEERKTYRTGIKTTIWRMKDNTIKPIVTLNNTVFSIMRGHFLLGTYFQSVYVSKRGAGCGGVVSGTLNTQPFSQTALGAESNVLIVL